MKNQINVEEKKQLLKYYYEEKHYGQDKCARLLGPGIGRTTIKKWLKELDLPIRDFYAARNYSVSHKKYKNENYFQSQSHNMAWLLGFLASDGTISLNKNLIKIGLSNKDREILEKIKEELEIENKITDYTTNKGFEISELSWTCVQHKHDLAEYGIIPQKTQLLTPPIKLDKQFYLDYLRGYFDGDGSISQNSANGALVFSIGSATRSILEWIINFLYDDYNIPKINIYIDQRGQNNYYYFSYSTISTKKIFNLLYENPDVLKLERKYNKFKELIK